MLPDRDDKVRHAHLALAHVVETERPQHDYPYATPNPIDTAIPSGPQDRTTPRAQTRAEFDDDLRRRSSRMSMNLAGKFCCQWFLFWQC